MSLRENVTKNNFHPVGVSGPLQNFNRLGCHVFSESYHGDSITKLQELLVDVVGVLAWPMPGLGGVCWSYLSENI